jgi:L-idonate 5-dehydrogenase
MHYLSDGGIGTIRVREPIILGHEASGRVLEVGTGVTHVGPGDPVAVNPSRPCGQCAYCREGLAMHCLAMRFNGSAMRLPHEQGLFRDLVVVEAAQCVPLPQGADLRAAACAEPLAVCLHAANMAGEIAGKRVLVTGAGPIGSLCAAVAARRGAAEVVVTDLHDATLAVAAQMGATRGVNVARDGAALEPYTQEKGHFHIAFECSAAASAIQSCIAALRPRGTLVQIGVTGETPMPINALVAKEILVQGTHRFHEEFPQAVEAIASSEIDPRPIITARYPMERATEAFREAGDRSRSVKVLLDFGTL